jgi:BON domain
MANETLERHVTDELWWDPKIDSEAIAVSVDDGIVTLRGTVCSFRQKREAKRAAERVYGVRNVNNKLDVRILTEHRREDVAILSPRPDAGEYTIPSQRPSNATPRSMPTTLR